MARHAHTEQFQNSGNGSGHARTSTPCPSKEKKATCANCRHIRKNTLSRRGFLAASLSALTAAACSPGYQSSDAT